MMEINVPMKARKSNRRLAPKQIGLSFRRIKSPIKPLGQKRYIVSVALFAVNVIALVIGGVGSIAQEAAARDNYRDYRGYGGNSRSNNDRSNRDNDRKVVTPTVEPQTPNPTVTAQQPVVNEPTPESTPEAVTTIVVTPPPAQPDPAPVDTAPEVAKTASAQASTNTTTPVTYTSQQISDETRNRLLALAISAATSGAMIYLMSFFGAGSSLTKRAIPVQYIRNGREVSLN